VIRIRLLFAGLLGWAYAAQAAPPLEAYGQLPSCEMAALSESGQRYAIVGVVGEKRRVVVVEANDKVVLAQDLGDVKVRRVYFAGDDLLLIELTRTESLGPRFNLSKYEFGYVAVADLKTGKVTFLMQRGNTLGQFDRSFGVRKIDGRWFGFFSGLTGDRRRSGANNWKDGIPDLYRVDLQSGAQTLLSEMTGSGYYRSWLIDANGQIAAYMDEDSRNGRWSIYSRAIGATIASGNDPRLRAYLIGLGDDGTSLLYSRAAPDGRDAWLAVPLAGGAETPLLPGVDIRSTIESESEAIVAGYARESDLADQHFFSPRREKRMAAARKAFPGLNVSIEGWSADFGVLLVETSGNADSGMRWRVDLATGQATNLAASYSLVQPEDVGPISVIDYTAGDGTRISGVLTLPPHHDSKRKLPLVVLPHGGPTARDHPDFDWWAQAFAVRGYAVFQPNFRGSTGYGHAFEAAGHGEWGRKMQTDISDGVLALADKGVIDPKRTCIVGASYGGYAALAGVTLQNGLYRCAVSVAGVADLPALYRYNKAGSGNVRGTRLRWEESIGTHAVLADISPASFAAKADAPILLIHGKDDVVVPYQQSRTMQDALTHAGKPVELVTLPGEDHWLSRSETRLALLKASVAFVEKYNPAD
jgi:dipeptidyl aminopeptidase/acylaminoacyl peptidase